MVYFITGGERSGKSRFAQQLALSLTNQPVYVATARKWDSDFEERIARHQQERDTRWTNYEEEKHISCLPLHNRVAVIDCITLWLTNFYTDTQYDLAQSLQASQAELDALLSLPADLIIISNEIGMGVHAHTQTTRKFVELHGWINQHIATRADQVFLLVAGIPLKVK